MRVLAVANWRPDATRAQWATTRLAALTRAGLDIELLAIDCIGAKRGWLTLWHELNARLATGRYDVVAPLYGSFLGLLCAAQRRVPCVMSFVGSDLSGPPSLSLELLSVPASQLTAALADGVSVHNRAMQRALWWPPARKRAHILSDPVDTTRFFPRDRKEARQRRGLPLAERRVLFVAAKVEERPVKRLELARAAVSRLPDVALEVASSLPVSEMPWVYASADALLLTSHAEGSPNCVKEALACGVPVVAVDVGDVREILDGVGNCAVVPADADAIAAALAEVLADGGGCPDGPPRIAARYSPEAVAARFSRLYADACKQRAHTASHSAMTRSG